MSALKVPRAGFCDLCGDPIPPGEINDEAFKATGLLICTQCLEDSLHAEPFDARSEVGLVGRGGGRS